MKHLMLIILVTAPFLVYGQTYHKGTGIGYFADTPNVTPDTTYGAEIGFSIENKQLYRWDRDSSQWYAAGGRLFTITTVPDTSTTNPLSGDHFLNSTQDTLGIYTTSWVVIPLGGTWLKPELEGGSDVKVTAANTDFTISGLDSLTFTNNSSPTNSYISFDGGNIIISKGNASDSTRIQMSASGIVDWDATGTMQFDALGNSDHIHLYPNGDLKLGNTTTNNITAFSKYNLANGFPSTVNADTTVMAWRGNGSTAVPIFINVTDNLLNGPDIRLETDSITGSTITADFNSEFQRIHSYDMTSAGDTVTLTLNNPVVAGKYIVEFSDVVGTQVINWPATVVDLNRVSLGYVTYSGPVIKTLYYDGTNYIAPPEFEPVVNFVQDSITGTTLTIDLDFEYQRVHELDMASATNLTLTVNNPTSAGVYTLHFLGISGTDNVTFPANFYDMNGVALGTDALTAGVSYTCYYNPVRTNYYCK